MTIFSVLITGGTGFVGHWMKAAEPENVAAVYLNRTGYNNSLFGFDYYVHLANVPPTRVLRQNKRTLYCSSGIVYHPENDIEYRQNKMLWEAECLASGVDVVIARLFTFYGARLDGDKAFTRFKIAAENGEPLQIWGDGTCVRSYMYGAELGRWMWAILFRGKSGEAYDVGSDHPVTILQLAQSFSDNIVIQGGTDPMPVYLPPDTTKTKGLL